MSNKIKEAIPYVFLAVVLVILIVEYSRFNSFTSKGPRFTAYDGQELCERLRTLERRVGTTINIPCEYLKEK